MLGLGYGLVWVLGYRLVWVLGCGLRCRLVRVLVLGCGLGYGLVWVWFGLRGLLVSGFPLGYTQGGA